MNDEEFRKVIELEGTLASRLDEVVCDSLHDGIAGLTWSPGMPENDPDAELLVVDRDGVEYVLDIDVDLCPTGRKKGGPVDITPPPPPPPKDEEESDD